MRSPIVSSFARIQPPIGGQNRHCLRPHIKELAIDGPIDDIVWTEKSLYLFEKNVYYESLNPKATKEGKVVVSKPTCPNDIRTVLQIE